jgi:hypothetical protein
VFLFFVPSVSALCHLILSFRPIKTVDASFLPREHKSTEIFATNVNCRLASTHA